MDESIESETETQIYQVVAIDQATMTPFVQSALNHETVELIDWECEQLHTGAGEGSAVYRFSGQGQDQGQTVPWSLILKTIQPNDFDCEPSDWNYCKREVDAYQSGWLDDLPVSLVAPACYGVIEYPDGTCWIWLEDIKDAIGEYWPLEHYGIVARHVGQFNGVYLMGGPIPTWPWLNSGFLRRFIAQSAPSVVPLHNMLDQPLVRRWLSGDSSDKFFCIWEDRSIFIDTLDNLPQTICHFDVHRRNLFAGKTAGGDDQTIAVDWAFTGRGAIGEEIVPLVWAYLGFFEVEIAQALENIVFESYLTGLGDAGWQGDPRYACLGYTAASIRYMFYEIWRFLEIIRDETLQGWVEQTFGKPIEQVCDDWGQLLRLIDRRTHQARELMNVLDLVPTAAS